MISSRTLRPALLWAVVALMCLQTGVWAAEQTPAATPAPAPAATPVPAPAAAPSADEVVARVDEQVITRQEWLQAVSQTQENMRRMGAAGQLPPGAPPTGELTEEQRRKVLDGIINARVMESLVKKSGITVSDAEVDDAIKKFKESQGIKTDEEFNTFLQKQQISIDMVKKQIHDQMVGEKYVKETAKDIQISDADVQAEYDKRKAAGRMELPENVDVGSLLVRINGVDDVAVQEAKKKIDAARERVNKGEDFAKVAEEVSDDPGKAQNKGVYQHVTRERGPFGQEFVTAAFALPLNQVSEPFRTRAGWHIIKVLAKHDAGSAPFEDVKEGLKNVLIGEKRKEIILKTISDAREKMKVEITLPPPSVAAPPTAPDEKKPDDAGNSLLIKGSS